MKSFLILLCLFFFSVVKSQVKTAKVHYLDTNFVNFAVEAFYIGCKAKKVDTVYFVDYRKRETCNWEVYYDKKLKNKMFTVIHNEDTLITTYYFKNGQKRKEDITKGSITRGDYAWLTSAEWCENGQLVQSTLGSVSDYQKVTHYHCNGKKKWEANIWNGALWGIETKWYENGQKMYEKRYTEYVLYTVDNTSPSYNEPIGPNKYWDEYGNELNEDPDDRRQRINTYGMPTQVHTAKYENQYPNIVPYYAIMESENYDAVMTSFQNKIYETTEKNKDCSCSYGEVYFTFIVTEEGKIENIEPSSSKVECYATVFLGAIKRLGYWEPIKINNEKVSVLVSVGLKIESLKK